MPPPQIPSDSTPFLTEFQKIPFSANLRSPPPVAAAKIRVPATMAAVTNKRSRPKPPQSRPIKHSPELSPAPPLDSAVAKSAERVASLRSAGGSNDKKRAATRVGDGSGKKSAGRGKKAARVVVIDISSGEEEEEDDCCVLDSDPFFSPNLKSKMSNCGNLQDDDIVIVNERGQVACRDFPHSRHLCVKYPFSATAQETYCSKCYCYVCDVAAPCKNWKGKSGHCHASDEDQKWKDMRRTRPRKKVE